MTQLATVAGPSSNFDGLKLLAGDSRVEDQFFEGDIARLDLKLHGWVLFPGAIAKSIELALKATRLDLIDVDDVGTPDGKVIRIRWRKNPAILIGLAIILGLSFLMFSGWQLVKETKDLIADVPGGIGTVLGGGVLLLLFVLLLSRR